MSAARKRTRRRYLSARRRRRTGFRSRSRSTPTLPVPVEPCAAGANTPREGVLPGPATLNHRLPAEVTHHGEHDVWIESRRPPRMGCCNWLELHKSSWVAGRRRAGGSAQGVGQWAGEVTVEQCSLVRIESVGEESVAVFRSRLVRVVTSYGQRALEEQSRC